MPLEIFNTLGRKKEAFQAKSKTQVNLYTCGPTVYNYVHIGNLRSYIHSDILKRVLNFLNYNVRWVMNITDVDDKTIGGTIKEAGDSADVTKLEKFTNTYTQAFLSDLDKINIVRQDIEFVKVTEKISDIQLFILELLKKGYAYRAEDGSVYFSIEKYQQDFNDYDKLVGEKFLEGKKIGARVNSDEYEKDNLSDFALWKAHGTDDAQIYWEHPELVKGRPGWHIECTLINYLKFPEGTDIHTGGIDLIFPHHTNEIAQAQPVYRPFVNYWLHSEHILIDGKKMSKSLGNFWTLEDLEKQQIGDGLSLRYLYLQSHYRSPLNVTEESLRAAKSGLRNLKNKIAEVALLDKQKQNRLDENPSADETFLNRFKNALSDDLNTAEALSIMQSVLTSDLQPNQKLATIFRFDEVLGLDLNQIENHEIIENPHLQALVEKRDSARVNKDYQASDKLRLEIEELGYEVLDTLTGTKIRKR